MIIITKFGTKLKNLAGITGVAAAASVISLTATGAGAVPVMAAPANYITQTQAKTAATDHSKVKVDRIYDLDIDFEKNRSKVYYDVEFKADGYEYDYKINATDATVIRFEKKAIKAKKSATSKKTTETKITSYGTKKTSYIGTAKAKNIALNHAKLTASKVTRLKAELDKERGVYIYETEFRYGNYEYEYDINAITGNIIRFDKEYKCR